MTRRWTPTVHPANFLCLIPPRALIPPSAPLPASRFPLPASRSRSPLMSRRTPAIAPAAAGRAAFTAKTTQSSGPRFLPLLLLLFIGSGCAALIYEIVWFQMLQLIVGSSAISLGVVLGTFMGGMCLGSLYLSKVISAKEHPLR